jgi:hypothetical protein
MGSLYTETGSIQKHLLNAAAFVLTLETSNLIDLGPSSEISVLLAGFIRVIIMQSVIAPPGALSGSVQKW